MTTEQIHRRGTAAPRSQKDAGYYEISYHARLRLAERWPDTVLRPQCFDYISVPRNSRLLGYDSFTGARYVIVPKSPMVAVMQGDVLISFLTRQTAENRLSGHGYGPEDLHLYGKSRIQNNRRSNTPAYVSG